LWVTDSARTGLIDVPNLDELNAVRWGAHFGWPYCVGKDNQPAELAGDFDCTTAAAPALTFPTGSTPTGMVAYTSDTLPDLNGSLIVILRGSYNQPDLRGYAVVAVRFDEQGVLLGYDLLIPFENVPAGRTGYSLSDMNYRNSGFWPYRPLDITVSREGWLYLSVSGGQILVIRPA
jgi:glucose/arabinose dehydrogenase